MACEDEEVAKRLRALCHPPAFRPYSSIDVIGCELGGAYKNVIALSGRHGGRSRVRRQHHRLGDHPWASPRPRGSPTALGADPMTLMGLAGLGDLVATCSSPLSRNRTFGEKLGQGMTTAEITASTRQVAEGVKSCSSLLDLAKRADVYAPIVEHVHAVVEGEMTAGRHAQEPRQPRHQARARLGRLRRRRPERAPVTWSSAAARSSQRSSTSSMPTDIRTSPSGMVAGSLLPAPPPLEGGLDPAEAGGVHPQGRLARQQVGGERALGEHDRHDGAEAGVAHLADGGVLRQAAHQLLGVGLRALEPHVQRPQAAQRQPGLEGAGHRADQVAALLEHVEELRVAGDEGAEQHVAVPGEELRRRVHHDVGVRGRAAAGAGEWRRCCRRRRRPRPRGPLVIAAMSATSRAGLVGDSSHTSAASVARGHDGGGVGDVDEHGLDPAARLQVGDLHDAAVVGVPRGDHHLPWPTRSSTVATAASPEAKAAQRPPSRAPSASSNAAQVGLP